MEAREVIEAIGRFDRKMDSVHCTQKPIVNGDKVAEAVEVTKMWVCSFSEKSKLFETKLGQKPKVGVQLHLRLHCL